MIVLFLGIATCPPSLPVSTLAFQPDTQWWDRCFCHLSCSRSNKTWTWWHFDRCHAHKPSWCDCLKCMRSDSWSSSDISLLFNLHQASQKGVNCPSCVHNPSELIWSGNWWWSWLLVSEAYDARPRHSDPKISMILYIPTPAQLWWNIACILKLYCLDEMIDCVQVLHLTLDQIRDSACSDLYGHCNYYYFFPPHPVRSDLTTWQVFCNVFQHVISPDLPD